MARRLVALDVDMIWTGDDMGSQTGTVNPPSPWRRLFRPRMARSYAELKSINPNVTIACNWDGDITPVHPDVIEVGMDVLNPAQPACMDPAAIARRYGIALCLWGPIHHVQLDTSIQNLWSLVDAVRSISWRHE